MTRPARVVIDLSALRHNFSRVRQLAPQSRIIAIVKADAYGHGLVRVAEALPDADAFGVACLEEARELREAGIAQSIILLEGPFAGDELPEIRRLGLDLVIHTSEQITMLERHQDGAPLRLWLKIDSGMHRLGFEPAQTRTVYERLRQLPGIGAVHLMTHFADASNPFSEMTTRQLALFDEACTGIDAPRSLANSAAILNWPATHADYVRPGLMLYGISPTDDTTSATYELRPVMGLHSSLIAMRDVRKGETVGYGAGWICPRDMRIGIVAAGYGDGFPRHGHSGTPVLVNGTRCTIVGNPSMDMLAVDLTPVPDALHGDPVELWGARLPVEEIARHAGTIPYELVAAVHRRLRVVVHEPQ